MRRFSSISFFVLRYRCARQFLSLTTQIYTGSELFDSMLPFAIAATANGPQTHAEALVSQLVGVMCWLSIGRVLYLKKIFVAL